MEPSSLPASHTSPSVSSHVWMAVRWPKWTCLATWIVNTVICETTYCPWPAWVQKCERLFKTPPVMWWLGVDITSSGPSHRQPEAPKVAARLFKAEDCPEKSLGSHFGPAALSSEGPLHLGEHSNLGGIWVKKGSLGSCYRQSGEESWTSQDSQSTQGTAIQRLVSNQGVGLDNLEKSLPT